MYKSENLTKKRAIKIFSIIILGTILVALIFAFMIYGRHFPVKAFLLALAIVLPIMILTAIITYKQRDKIKKSKKKVSRKIAYLYIILGGLVAITSMILLFIEEIDKIYYLNIIVGIIFILSGIVKLKKIKC